jgi:hypothetical protein
MSDAAGGGSAQSADTTPVRAKGTGLAMLIVLAGVVVSGIAAGAVASSAERQASSGRPGNPQLSIVSPDDLATAASTLLPGSRDRLVAEAKTHREPLAVVTISGVADRPGGYVRIKSGTYISPYFRVGSIPQRVAIPLPAPYAAGKGTIVVEGAASDVQVALSPSGWWGQLMGQSAVNVIWPTTGR